MTDIDLDECELQVDREEFRRWGISDILEASKRLRSRKDYDRAIRVMSFGAELKPKSPKVLNELATNLWEAGRTAEAFELCKKMVNEQFEKLSVWQVRRCLAIYYDSGSSEALGLERKVDEKYKGRAKGYFVKAHALSASMRHKAASEVLFELYSKGDQVQFEDEAQRVNCYYLLYRSLRLSGDLTKAKAILEEGLDKFGHPHKLRKELIVLSRHANYLKTYPYPDTHAATVSKFEDVKKGVLSGGLGADGISTLRELVHASGWQAGEAALISVFESLAQFVYDPTMTVGPEEGAEHYPKLKKLFVGGMDWSGSGAVQYYLHEYEQVKQLPGGELQFISGERSLESVVGSAEDRFALARSLVEFLQFHVLNAANPVSNQESKALMTSALFLRKLKKGEAAKVARDFVLRVLSSAGEKSEIEKACRNYVNGMISTLNEFDENTYYLFDNAIALFKVESIRLVDNFTYFATVRDPRSNYVTRVLQDKSYNKDVHLYAETYRERRTLFEEGKTRVSPSLGLIELVDFERFVLSEDYRLELATKAELNLTAREPFSIFKPWESVKNVTIHHGYENLSELAVLESELSDYCR